MAFLGIRLEHGAGRLLADIDVPGRKESASEYHITILCFEENWPISEVAKSLEVAFDVFSKTKPFTIKVKNITSFPKFENNPIPIIAKVESKELHELRDKLAKKFKKAKIDFKKTFKDYKPHITLSYVENKEDEKKIEDFIIDPLEIVVQEAVLWAGDNNDDRLFITFPLKPPEKHALLVKKTEFFDKVASYKQPYFTKSRERRNTSRNH